MRATQAAAMLAQEAAGAGREGGGAGKGEDRVLEVE